MDLATAKLQFLQLANSLPSECDRTAFFQWLGQEVVVPGLETGPNKLNPISEDGNSNLQASIMLERIAGSLRSKLPVEAILPSESIAHPTSGEDAGLSPQNCVHVDSFLYDESWEDALIQEGKLSRSYCLDCGSRRIEDLTYITHSCSKERLQFIFSELLPPLQGKSLLDIGSRLGAVLYGAYYLSQASRIVGVELNEDLCRLQQEMVQTYALGDRVSIVPGDMCQQAGLVSSADVTVLNNVFSWFMPPQLQVTMWQFLRSHLSPGSLLVTIPSLETSLQSLNTGIDLTTWVRPLSEYKPTGDQDDQVEMSEIKLYQVLSPA